MDDVREKPKRPYTSLEVSSYELPWALKDLVNKIPDFASSIPKKIVVDYVFDLGIRSNEELRQAPYMFLAKVLTIRDCTSHF